MGCWDAASQALFGKVSRFKCLFWQNVAIYAHFQALLLATQAPQTISAMLHFKLCRGDVNCGRCSKELEGQGGQGGQALVVRRALSTLLDSSEAAADKVFCPSCSGEALPHLRETLQPVKKGLKRKRE